MLLSCAAPKLDSASLLRKQNIDPSAYSRTVVAAAKAAADNNQITDPLTLLCIGEKKVRKLQ